MTRPEKESQDAALARYYRERQLSADGDIAKAWGLAASMVGRSEIKCWFSLERAGDTVTIWIRDEIGCFGFTAALLLNAIKGINNIHLHINSCGGDSGCALELFQGLQGRVIDTMIHQKCFSAAATLAMVGQRIKIEQAARFMLHPPRLFRYGQSADLRQSADYLDGITGRIREIIQKRTQQPESVVKAWLSSDDIYFDAKTACDNGLADEIFTEASPPAQSLTPAIVETDESRVWKFLHGLDTLHVEDRPRFLDSLARWAFYKTKQV